jgi:hypothetical protein
VSSPAGPQRQIIPEVEGQGKFATEPSAALAFDLMSLQGGSESHASGFGPQWLDPTIEVIPSQIPTRRVR